MTMMLVSRRNNIAS